jgi:cobalt-precorrin 5A hydrolase
MKLGIIAFTGRGGHLAKRLGVALTDLGHEARAYCFHKYAEVCGLESVQSAKQWASEQFSRCDGLVFVSATGIAVRTIAPLVDSKRTDPAGVVVDEAGRFAISLLSGHIGGANELARTVAEAIGAIAVVTTATDVNGKIAIDVFAEKNDLFITSMAMAKEVSAAVLAGEQIGFFCDYETHGACPRTLRGTGTADQVGGLCAAAADTLVLCPRDLTLGIGCKKGTAAEDIAGAAADFLAKNNVPRACVARCASVDLKAREAGLLAFCREAGLEIRFYTAEELNELTGDFSRSAFVEKTAGVDCVCERAAVKNAGGGLLIEKTKYPGITLALAGGKERIEF